MSSIFIEKKDYSSLVSPQRNYNLPIYKWYSFKHSFSKELVEKLITEFNLVKGSWVLDPFCGGGTTLLTCRERGINSQGFDILPFAVFLSKVKTQDYNEIELLKQLVLFRNEKKTAGSKTIKDLPDIPIVEKAFNQEVKKELITLKNKIANIKDERIRDFFNLGLLSILENVSNTSKAGGFLRIINRDVSDEMIHKIYLDKITSMIYDVTITNNLKKFKNILSKAELGDARKLNRKKKYDAIITSPPYPNRHDYTRIYALEMIFDFVSNNADLKKIRYETIRSHVEAKKKYTAPDYNAPELLIKLISQVNKNGTNNPQIINMLNGYFEDMYLSLSEMHRCLKTNGKIGLVVSNVRFSGVNIPVDELLSIIGDKVGLSTKEIWLARYRGNSSQQMRDYTRRPSRESIIIFEKK